jgi:predicted XRE-type DNA-binding protein
MTVPKRLPESLIEIDRNALDEEWAKQPKLMLKWAELLAEAKLKHAEAKAAVKVIQAKVAKYVRHNPKKYDVAKITESAVEAAVVMDDRVQGATSLLNHAAYQVDLLEAAVDSIRQKKASLEDMVYLHGMGYFAEPRLPRGEVRDEFLQHRRETARKKVKVHR